MAIDATGAEAVTPPLTTILTKLAYDRRICRQELEQKQDAHSDWDGNGECPWTAEEFADRRYPFAAVLDIVQRDTGLDAKKLAIAADSRFKGEVDTVSILNECDRDGRTDRLLRRLIETSGDVVDRLFPGLAVGCEQASVGVSRPDQSEIPHDDKSKVSPPARITQEEANTKAFELLAREPSGGGRWTVRSLAGAIGCSNGTAANLSAWKTYAKAKGVGRDRARKPKTVSLTTAIEAMHGNADKMLEKLKAEQAEDDEISPLSNSSRRFVRSHKEL